MPASVAAGRQPDEVSSTGRADGLPAPTLAGGPRVTALGGAAAGLAACLGAPLARAPLP
jgi:hypothetical protein